MQEPLIIGLGMGLVLCLVEFFILTRSYRAKELAAQETNRAQESKLQSMLSLNKIYTACFAVDLQKNTFSTLYCTKEVRNIVGDEGSAQDGIRKLCDTIVTPEFAEPMRMFIDLSTLNERLADKEVITCEYKGIFTGWCQAYFIAGDRDENGVFKNAFFAARTIQEEKEKEEAQNRNLAAALTAAKSANRAKSAFLFNMSHDIRTPMNAIAGFAELLEKNAEDKVKVIDYATKIQSSNATLLTLVNNVLEMARLESGKTIVEEEYWDIRLFNETLTNVFADSMKKHGLYFQKTTDITHHHVLCDTTKVQKIFLNLLSNAMKFTPPGGSVKFDMTEIQSELDGFATFKVTIEDDGIGMSEDFVKSIFDDFTKERSSTESGVEGSGLGMAIVKNLVDFLGGKISVESAIGSGSKFTVILPLKIATQEDIDAPEKEARELQKRDFTGKRVLLAEDNELNAEIAMAILKEAGIEVDRVENGKECYKKLEEASNKYYDIILMDIQMPIMNGYEATREFRGMPQPEKAEIPIIAMTANAFDEDRRNSLIAGMNAHLAKPIDVNDLFKTLNKFI